MRRVARVLLLAVFMTVAGDRALAQEVRSLGLTIGYPASVGVLWQVSSRLGLRPELALDFSTTETAVDLPFSGTITTSTDSWEAGVGISALILVRRWDATSFYITPRYVFTTGDSTTTRDPPDPRVVTADGPRRTIHAYSGSVGFHQAIGTRFGIFGELGLRHQRFHGQAIEASGTGISSGAGIVFMF